MVAAAPTTLMTVEDLLALTGHVRYELIEGELVEIGPAHKKHGAIVRWLDKRLGWYFDAHPELGDVWTSDTGYIVQRDAATVCVPDLAILNAKQVAIGNSDDEPGNMPFAPMIPVEITSPNDTEAEIARKLSLYLGAEVREVWWVRPTHRTITVHRPDGRIEVLRLGDTLTTDALPGFSLDVSGLFAL